jgi:hypothetical protein
MNREWRMETEEQFFLEVVIVVCVYRTVIIGMVIRRRKMETGEQFFLKAGKAFCAHSLDFNGMVGERRVESGKGGQFSLELVMAICVHGTEPRSMTTVLYLVH